MREIRRRAPSLSSGTAGNPPRRTPCVRRRVGVHHVVPEGRGTPDGTPATFDSAVESACKNGGSAAHATDPTYVTLFGDEFFRQSLLRSLLFWAGCVSVGITLSLVTLFGDEFFRQSLLRSLLFWAGCVSVGITLSLAYALPVPDQVAPQNHKSHRACPISHFRCRGGHYLEIPLQHQCGTCQSDPPHAWNAGDQLARHSFLGLPAGHVGDHLVDRSVSYHHAPGRSPFDRSNVLRRRYS